MKESERSASEASVLGEAGRQVKDKEARENRALDWQLSELNTDKPSIMCTVFALVIVIEVLMIVMSE